MRVQLVHWRTEEGAVRAKALREAGYKVDIESFDPFPVAFKRLKADPPDVLVVDLTRLPSAGRDVALAVREAKATRHIPIVFVDGDPTKVQAIRRLLPDASYTSWRGVRGALRRALARPVHEPVVPGSRLAGYSGTPLPRKLGIKPAAVIALLGAPEGFERLIQPLPAGADVRRNARGNADLIIWFVRRRSELERGIAAMQRRVGRDGLWIAWPKKTSGIAGDVSEPVVRATGLAHGLVDYKIAAIDETWSGLKFSRRKARDA